MLQLKGMDLEQHGDNTGGSSGSGQALWTNAMSSFVLQFLANLVANGTRTSNGFKQVHLNSCARALNEHYRLQVTGTQISNHLRKWKRFWAKVNKLKNLNGALWDEDTFTILIDQEHYWGHIKDNRSDAEFLNTPIKHYHEMATLFGNDMASGVYAKSGRDPLATDVNGNENENDYVNENENENGNGNTKGGSEPVATVVEEATMSFSNTNGRDINDTCGIKPAKKAKVNNDDEMLSLMARSFDILAKAIEKSATADTDVPEDLWDNMMNLRGFEEAQLAHYYAYLCENLALARAFNKLSMSNKMTWVARYIKNHLSG